MSSIQAVQLWHPYTRIIHWIIAFESIFLAVSGWLINHAIVDIDFWSEWHSMAGQLLVLILVARLVILIKIDHHHYSKQIFSRHSLTRALELAKFYLSLARLPLPQWRDIHPFWIFLYIAFYVFLILTAISGLLYGDELFLGMYLPSVHASLSGILVGWMCLHIIAVFIHDWKGKVNRISAMLSGVAYFENTEPEKTIHTDLLNTKFKKLS